MKHSLVLGSLLLCLLGTAMGQKHPRADLPDTRSGHQEDPSREPLLVCLNLGAFDLFDPGNEVGVINVECYLPWRLFFSYPYAGAFVTTNTSTFTYVGMTIPIYLTRRLLFRLNFAPGIYTSMEPRSDLGLPFEVMTALKITYKFANDARLGLQFAHISNVGLGRQNPGAETLVMSLEIPLGNPVR